MGGTITKSAFVYPVIISREPNNTACAYSDFFQLKRSSRRPDEWLITAASAVCWTCYCSSVVIRIIYLIKPTNFTLCSELYGCISHWKSVIGGVISAWLRSAFWQPQRTERLLCRCFQHSAAS